jgi:hypothetical protein
MPLVLNGTTGVQDNSGAFVAGTAVASTSGTSIDFTSIPSWAKRVTINLDGVSTNGTSFLRVQIGSGSVDTSGYTSFSSAVWNTLSTISDTSGFAILMNAASYALSGSITINLLGSNTYVASGLMSFTGLSASVNTSGSKTLSGVLDRVRLTTVNGTDTFDAGTVNITYE